MKKTATYANAGVDIDVANATKKEISSFLESSDSRVLNRLGPFASLFEVSFPGYKEPVLVLKSEEPGSKQLLAMQHGRVSGIAFDLINHLINDIVVMGATPLVVLDTIICGNLEKEVVVQLVKSMAQACRHQSCTLIGGETSEQPGVIPSGRYVICASILGVVDNSKILDGSQIKEGDQVVSLPSNGLHTNGYTLVRHLIDLQSDIIHEKVGGETFLDAILKPHLCYFTNLKGLLDKPELHGLAHITGGGIGENLNRILPEGLDALIDLNRIQPLPIFTRIQKAGNISNSEMIRTFNLGVGMTAVVKASATDEFCRRLEKSNCPASPIGAIIPGDQSVEFQGELRFR